MDGEVEMKKITTITSLVFLLLGCKSEPPPVERGTILQFVENDGAGGATPVRMTIGRKYVRIDGGEDDKDFLLYDREKRTVYNVSSADKLVLAIPPRAAPAGKTPKLTHRIKRQSTTYPSIDGRPVIHYRLLTNGRVCYDVYAADGLLPEAVLALREYREALAGEHHRAIGFTPSEQKAPCDLANHVYAPARHLAHGFPVRLVEMDPRDAKRRRVTELTNYKTDVVMEQKLFELPAGYRRMMLGELQTRAAR